MKRKILIGFLLLGATAVGTEAQFGSGIVFDPTNYHNALLRYYQLEQQLAQLKNSYSELVAQYKFAVQMAKNIQNMPSRYRAAFSQWKDSFAADTYGNTAAWVDAINSAPAGAPAAYNDATTRLLVYSQDELSGMSPEELARVQSQYATVELADGANSTAMAAIGSIRSAAPDVQAQVANLESDSFSSDPDLNTEVAVLNKINAAGVLTLQTLQDSNKLLASLLEEQTILAKQQREATSNIVNAEIERQAGLEQNMSPMTATLTDSLQNFRMP